MGIKPFWWALLGAFVGGHIVYIALKPRIEKLERLSQTITFRMSEFETNYHNDINKIWAEHKYIWSKINELQRDAKVIREMHDEIQNLKNRLNLITNLKLKPLGYKLA